mgnify:CR=1 FL=1
MVLALPSGYLADRFSRRKVVVLSLAGMTVTSLCLGVLSYTEGSISWMYALLVMDATFTQDEYMEKMTWGHCYPEYCVRLAEIAGVKRVALFHHSPDTTDADLDAVAVRWERHTAPSVFPAKEGLVVDLEG